MNTILPQTRNSSKKKTFFFPSFRIELFFPHCCSALTALILPCIFFSRRASLYCFSLHTSAVTVPALCLSLSPAHLKNKSKKKINKPKQKNLSSLSSDLQLSLNLTKLIIFFTTFCIVFFYRHVVTPKPSHPILLTKTWNPPSNS